MPESDLLLLDGLSVGCRVPVLENLTFSASPGERIGILGPNGCGKTTLLRTIAGNLRPLSGSLRWRGASLPALSAKERAMLVAYLPQNPVSAEGVTVLDEIEMGLMPSRGIFFRRTPDDTAKIRALAEEAGIAELLDRPLSGISGGERQTAALIRAQVQDTPLLLLDEPSAALDFDRSHALYRRLEFLSRERGKLILAVLHDPAAALAFCTRILLLKDGAMLRELFPLRDSARELEDGLRLLYPDLRIRESGGFRFCVSAPGESDFRQSR